MNLVQAYTSWQPLEEVIVGSVYGRKHFSYIKDKPVRKKLGRILEETAEDLDNLQRTIEKYGARVRRPVPYNEIFFQHQATKPNAKIPQPPIVPRDWQITLGEKLLRIVRASEFDMIMDDYQQAQPGSVICPHIPFHDYNHPLVGAVASCIVRVGTDVFFDNSEWMTNTHMEWIRDNVLDHRYRVHRARTDGHGDAVFAILKPGVILSSMHDAHINYRETFPGWEVCRLSDSTIQAAMKVGQFKRENFNGRWWAQGTETDPAFAAFVDTYLNEWTGYVSETVFDVNCLVLDEENVIFSGYNRDVFDFCERHRINPIISELRHRYFWDGGISCVTQDVRRRGGLETYL